MLVQVGLCRTWSETTLLFSHEVAHLSTVYKSNDVPTSSTLLCQLKLVEDVESLINKIKEDNCTRYKHSRTFLKFGQVINPHLTLFIDQLVPGFICVGN